MNRIFSTIIRVYQLTISPIFTSLGGGCRFHPSCSAYSREAFRGHRWPRALAMSIWRVLRCNPFSEGGEDPVI